MLVSQAVALLGARYSPETSLLLGGVGRFLALDGVINCLRFRLGASKMAKPEGPGRRSGF